MSRANACLSSGSSEIYNEYADLVDILEIMKVQQYVTTENMTAMLLALNKNKIFIIFNGILQNCM